MKKGIVAFVAAIALAAPTSAAAAAPTGTFVPNPNTNVNQEHASCQAVLGARIIQNGQFISGQENAEDIDQTTYPASRAEQVHLAQAQPNPSCVS